MIPVVSRPGTGGSEGRPHTAATSTRAAGSATGRPPGSSAGARPPRARRARPPAAGPRPAGLRWLAASRTAAVSAPGTAASRSPTSAHAAAARSPSAAARTRPALAGGAAPMRVSTSASVPGTAGRSGPPSLARPRDGVGRDGDLQPLAPTALRSRRKTIGDSSSGSKPTSSTAGAASSVGVRDAESGRARDGGGQEGGLLRLSAAGPGSRRRWCRARPGRTSRTRRRPRS